MVGICSAARSWNVPRSLVRNSFVLPWSTKDAVRWRSPQGVGGFLLLLCHLGALFEVCAGAKGGVGVAGDDQGAGWAGAALGGDGVDLLGKGVEEVSREGVTSFGAVEEEDADAAGAWGGDLLGLDDGVVGVGAGAVAGDGDAERDDARGAGESGCEARESGRHFRYQLRLLDRVEHSWECKNIKRMEVEALWSFSNSRGKLKLYAHFIVGTRSMPRISG